jgi:hypothetical protein
MATFTSTNETDVVLVGAGIMSATLAVFHRWRRCRSFLLDLRFGLTDQTREFFGYSRLLLRCLSNRSRDRIRKRSPHHPIRHRCKIHYSIFCHFPPHRCRECGHRCFAQVLS